MMNLWDILVRRETERESKREKNIRLSVDLQNHITLLSEVASQSLASDLLAAASSCGHTVIIEANDIE